jgi:hypothetical protein
VGFLLRRERKNTMNDTDKDITTLLGTLILAALIAFFVIWAIEGTRAEAETQPIDTECYCKAKYLNMAAYNTLPDCCREILVWPGSVTGTNCYGPLCPSESGDRTCNCHYDTGVEDCINVCHRRVAAIGIMLHTRGKNVRVIPEHSLCWNQEFPFEEVAGELFGELYLRVFENAGGFKSCGDANSALLHWEASWATLAQQNNHIQYIQGEIASCYERLDTCLNPPPTPTPTLPYNCEHTEDMIDGPGGAVWKPVSESNGRPVLLMPKSYCDTEVVEIYHGSQQVADMNQTDCEEFGRGVWRGAPRCSELPDNLVLVFDDGECRTVPDPCERYD